MQLEDSWVLWQNFHLHCIDAQSWRSSDLLIKNKKLTTSEKLHLLENENIEILHERKACKIYN